VIPPWAYLDEHDRAAFRAMVAFLNKRLAEPSTIEWALKLKPTHRIERIAVGDLLNSSGAQVLDEPWATAWRLIEEFWSSPASEEGPSTAIYDIQKRLRAGDRSGAIVSAIVDLVAPRLKVEPIESGRWQFVKKPRRPKTFNHLLSARLTSGNLIDLNVLKLAALSEVPFLNALAKALEATINHGLDLARRLGWDGQRGLWKLGNLGRVYYGASDGSRDPDAYHHGIAPSVKLLHAIVARIAELDAKAALPFVQCWRFAGSLVHIRLWAATARNSQLVAAEEVGAFLRGLDDRQFWDLHVFPEIAELRALRFGDLDPETRKAIAQRLRKGPPRDYWPKKADAARVRNARLYLAVREIKRIDVVGGDLSQDARTWMEANIAQFADLAAIAIDEGFPKASEAYYVPPNPDARYDTLDGATRLRALEAALSTSRGPLGRRPRRTGQRLAPDSGKNRSCSLRLRINLQCRRRFPSGLEPLRVGKFAQAARSGGSPAARSASRGRPCSGASGNALREYPFGRYRRCQPLARCLE
jgi:hypothetical protein